RVRPQPSPPTWSYAQPQWSSAVDGSDAASLSGTDAADGSSAASPYGTGAVGTGPADAGDDTDTSLPDQYPANSTDIESILEGTDMHDLDHTTMEFSGEEADFESESPFSEDEVEQFASRLLDIANEQEFDRCVHDLLRRGSRIAGPPPPPTVLNPLGGFLKS